jgi:hypothetical protein
MRDATLPSIPPCHETSLRYRLAPMVFPAATRHGMAFLNLKRNRYLGIGRADSLILSKYLDGLPTLDIWGTDAGELPNDDSRRAALLDSLTRSEILTLNRNPRSEIVSTKVSLDGDLVSIGYEITGEPSVGPREIALFLYCLLCSAVSLRVVPLRHIVRRVYHRRNAAVSNGYAFSLSGATKLVATFQTIRPYFFLSKDRCLLHALALIEYLAHHDQYPMLVFGVKTDPWGAHAWVQHGTFLLDCSPEQVCGLEQILGV